MTSETNYALILQQIADNIAEILPMGASEILTLLLSVDGIGSGLDADLLQGVGPLVFNDGELSDANSILPSDLRVGLTFYSNPTDSPNYPLTASGLSVVFKTTGRVLWFWTTHLNDNVVFLRDGNTTANEYSTWEQLAFKSDILPPIYYEGPYGGWGMFDGLLTVEGAKVTRATDVSNARVHHTSRLTFGATTSTSFSLANGGSQVAGGVTYTIAGGVLSVEKATGIDPQDVYYSFLAVWTRIPG